MKVQAQKVLEKLRLSIEEEKKEAANFSSQLIKMMVIVREHCCFSGWVLRKEISESESPKLQWSLYGLLVPKWESRLLQFAPLELISTKLKASLFGSLEGKRME